MTQSNKPEHLIYEQPKLMSRSELEQELASDDGERILSALISAFYSEDPNWVQKSCLHLATHKDGQARRAAAIVLGNVSGVHAKELNLMASLETLYKLRTDHEEAVKTAAEDSIETVLHMIGQLKKHQ